MGEYRAPVTSGAEESSRDYTNEGSYVTRRLDIGQRGSTVGAAAIEWPQREIHAAIAGAGLTPAAADLTQLLQAIQLLADSRLGQIRYQVENTLGGTWNTADDTQLFDAAWVLSHSWNTRTVSASEVLTAADLGKVLAINASAGVTLTLPPVADMPAGATIILRRTDSTTASLTISGHDPGNGDPVEAIDGATSLPLSPGDWCFLIRGNASWQALLSPGTLAGLSDVDTAGATAGQVLTRQFDGSSRFENQAVSDEMARRTALEAMILASRAWAAESFGGAWVESFVDAGDVDPSSVSAQVADGVLSPRPVVTQLLGAADWVPDLSGYQVAVGDGTLTVTGTASTAISGAFYTDPISTDFDYSAKVEGLPGAYGLDRSFIGISLAAETGTAHWNVSNTDVGASYFFVYYGYSAYGRVSGDVFLGATRLGTINIAVGDEYAFVKRGSTVTLYVNGAEAVSVTGYPPGDVAICNIIDTNNGNMGGYALSSLAVSTIGAPGDMDYRSITVTQLAYPASALRTQIILEPITGVTVGSTVCLALSNDGGASWVDASLTKMQDLTAGREQWGGVVTFPGPGTALKARITSNGGADFLVHDLVIAVED